MKNRFHVLIAFLLLICMGSYAQKPIFQHPEGRYIKVNGANLWIEKAGKGDPLFLISGGPGGTHVGLHSFDSLEDACTLIYIDNFGRGKSDTAKNVSEYSINRDVE